MESAISPARHQDPCVGKDGEGDLGPAGTPRGPGARKRGTSARVLGPGGSGKATQRCQVPRREGRQAGAGRGGLRLPGVLLGLYPHPC